MEQETVTVDAVINTSTFWRFAVFDMFKIRRTWRGPLIFALLMAGFAAVCFLLRGRAEGAQTLADVLLTVGLGLPAFYGLALFRAIRTQVKRYGLENPSVAYTLTLSREPDGVAAQNPGGQAARYEWKRLYGAWRNAGCVYLYVTKNKAFLLPEEQAKGGDLWEMVSAQCRQP